MSTEQCKKWILLQTFEIMKYIGIIGFNHDQSYANIALHKDTLKSNLTAAMCATISSNPYVLILLCKDTMLFISTVWLFKKSQ